MKVFLSGGTGFVGSFLTGRLAEAGHQVTILTRSKQDGRAVPQGVSLLAGDPTIPGDWQQKVADHDAIINLAGESIFNRWTTKTKGLIRQSRILTTRNIVQALCSRKGAATELLSASAVGYYGFREDEIVDEYGHSGNDFLALVSQAWEAEATRAEDLGVRVVLCRFGIVLGRDSGALKKMVPIFKMGLGSPLGSGKQWFPWIHEQDLVNILLFLMDRKDISGPVNCVAPNPVRNREMTKILGQVLGKSTFMPSVPGWALRLGMGEFGTVLLKGQKVVPKRLLDNGFTFQFSTIKEALENLITHQITRPE